jgi:hypothetical protein
MPFLSCEGIFSGENISNTSWQINYNWIIGGSGSADIYFFEDGSTDWGGTWTQEDDRITWTYISTTTLRTVTYSGTINKKQMTGTVINSGGDSGTWIAEKY